MSILRGIFSGDNVPFGGATSTTAGSEGLVPAPLAGQQNLFLRGDGTWAPASGGGGGDVFGPASSTDNAIARFDGATGKLIQNSVVTISDTGAIAGAISMQRTGGDLAIGTVTSGNTLITAAGSVRLQGITYPAADGTNGQILQTNGSGTLSFADNLGAFSPSNIVYVAKNGNDSTGDGTWARPYLTIQAAVNASTSGSNMILIAPGSYNENVTINNNGTSLTIQGMSDVQDSLNALWDGHLTLSGSTLRVRLANLNIQGQTAGTPTIHDNNTQGRHYITNCSVSHVNAATPSFRITSGSNWYNIDRSNIGNIELIGTPSNARSITATTSIFGSVLVSHVNYTLSARNMGPMGTITHSAGTVALDNVQFVVATSGDSIISTANLGSGLLFISNTSMQQLNLSFGRINKTGTCPYILGDIARNTAVDILTGTRLNFLRFSNDISGNYTPSNYAVTTQAMSDHLAGIDAALGALGVDYVEATADLTMVNNRGYITNKSASQLVYTLPATAPIGAVFEIVGKSNDGWRIAQNAGQRIHLGGVTTTNGITGFAQSSGAGDCVKLVCITANTEFRIVSSQGQIELL